jgi:hypothetical protein
VLDGNQEHHSQATAVSAQPWWTPFLGLVGTVLGFVLGYGVQWSDRRRRRLAHIAALRVEIESCARQAAIYLRDRTKSPVYRLPTVAFRASLPALLAEGALSESRFEPLLAFGTLVEDINRGLEQAARVANLTVDQEADRIALKCTHLLENHNGHDAYVSSARAAIRGIAGFR